MQQPGEPPVIIFDVGGVLLDWDPRYLFRKVFPGPPEAIERFLQEVGFYEWIMHQDAGRPHAEAVAELSGRFPAYTTYIQAYDARWEESLSGPIQGSVEIVRSLKQAGYPLHILSNWSAEKYQIVRPKHDFFNWFDSVLISGEVKLVKPDPRIFLLLLERIGRPAGDCIFIDDSPRNIEAAAGIGFKAIHFQSPEQLSQDLKGMNVLIG